MAIITTNDQHYKKIANTIRRLARENTVYKPENLHYGIEEVYQKGELAGKEIGYAEGHLEGFEGGESAEKTRFWQAYQEDGQRTNYTLAFAGVGWNEETFWPCYDITVQNGYQMFAYCAFAGSLKERLAECKVTMNFSGNKSLMNLFGFADRITELGVIDLSGVTMNYNTHIFNQCKSLRTIQKLIVPPNQSNWSAWFAGCEALENIVFEGYIITGGLDLSESPNLTRESMLSLFSALIYLPAGTSQNIILGATNLAKLSEDDKAIATQKGWTLA